MENPADIKIADIHRLPQWPIYVNNKRKCRPVIVKLTCAMDKYKIFQLAKNLKSYNPNRSDPSVSSFSSENNKQQNKQKIYITNHLPQEFIFQKRALRTKFLAARNENHNTSWKIEDGSYNLYVNEIKTEP